MYDLEKNSLVFNEDDPRRYIVSHLKNGKTFYPRTIPQKREHVSGIVIFILSICCFIGAAVVSGNFYFTIEAINYGILSLFFVTLVWRIILLLEEYTFHFSSRYNKCYDKLLRHIFHFPLKSSVLFCIVFSTVVMFFMQHGFIDNKKFDIAQMGLILCGIHFLRTNIGLQ